MESSTFAQLLYRYWFYGWMFRDVNRGNVFERAAAARHNRDLSRWLPTYLRRWTLLGLGCYALGVAIESTVPVPYCLLPYVVSTLAVPVNAVTLIAWLGLRTMPMP